MSRNLASCRETTDTIVEKYHMLQKDLQEVSGFWEGESSEHFMRNMNLQMEELQRDCIRMRVLLTGISQAMGIYDECERKMEGYVQS